MRKYHWLSFVLSLARILLLLIVLAFALPKIIDICSTLLAAITHKDEKPSGNPMRVEEKAAQPSDWGRFVFRLFP